MREHLKSLTKHSAIYSISTIIQRAQGLILLPIMTDTTYLASRSEYGDYSLIYAFIAFMNVFFLYGLDAAFLRYYFLGKHKRQDIYRSAIQVLALSAIISSLVIYLLSEPISWLLFNDKSYTFFVKIAAAILLTDTLCNLPYLILRAEERSVTYTAMRVGRFALELALNIVFIVYLKLGVKGILYANLIAALINLLALIPFQLPYLKGVFQQGAVRDLLKFGLPMIPNGLAYLVVEMSDRYLMLYLLNKETLGEYGANHKFGTLMLLVVSAFRTAWQPFFLKIANNPQAKKIYAQVMDLYVFAAACIVIAGGLLIEYIVTSPILAGKSLLGEDYWGGIQIIPLILLSYLFYGIYVNLTVGIYIQKKSSLMVIFTGFAAFTNIASNIYLMPRYGIMGAAYAAVLAYLVMTVSIFIANQRIFPVGYHFGRLGLIFLYMIGALLIYYMLNPDILIRLLIIGGFIPLYFLVKGSTDLRGSIKEIDE
jgi:O-antigen/teichoic acid export membrane protein